jgi:hydroxyacylglutathione hydrolase
LYPGRLYTFDVPAYTASAQRLVDFIRNRPVAHVLGTHIEQTNTPYLDYPTGTAYQPNEHSLALTRAHVLELNDAFTGIMKEKVQKVALPDFTVVPRTPPAAKSTP